MRIIGGTLKGRRLLAPKSIPARPTTDFAKESLFNILQNEIDWNATDFLDLFAGIGSITFEAASRGAASVLAIDLSHQSVRWITSTAKSLSLTNVIAYRADALKWLARNKKNYALVFADPPYNYELYAELIDTVLRAALIKNGLFILEHRQSASFSEHLNFAFDRTYGEVRFSFFRNQ